jgi:carbonic anhydrase/acetyltransferase-like protein (isoleucine patch superfamily)
VISGFCEIGESSFLGVNCTIENNTNIASDNFIGSGAIIRKDTSERDFFQEQQTDLAKIDSHRLFRMADQE